MTRNTALGAAMTAAALALSAWASVGAPAGAQDIALLAARVGADAGAVEETAVFYQEAFGLKEVNRFGGDAPGEIIMNFGDTVEAARASTAAQVVVWARPDGEAAGNVANLIFTVSDIQAVFDQAVATGARVSQEPSELGDTGVMIAFVVDPQGNPVELLEFPTEE